MARSQAANDLTVTMSGFGDFLDWRTVHFVGRCPTRNICTACGVLCSSVWITLCSHVFCPSCSLRMEAFDFSCPVDGKKISFEDAALLKLSESDLADYSVLCINAGRGCKFEGPLASLKQHFLNRCGFNKAECRRCGKEFARWHALGHSAACRVGLVPDAIRKLEAEHREDDRGRSKPFAKRGIDLAKDIQSRSPPAGKPTITLTKSETSAGPTKPQRGIIVGGVSAHSSQPVKKKGGVEYSGNLENGRTSHQTTSTSDKSQNESEKASQKAASFTPETEQKELSSAMEVEAPPLSQTPSCSPSSEPDNKVVPHVASESFTEISVHSDALPGSRTEEIEDNRAQDAKPPSNVNKGAFIDRDTQSEPLDLQARSSVTVCADATKKDSAMARPNGGSDAQIDARSSERSPTARSTQVVGKPSEE
ncbi:hypothetical protein V5799_010272 [Amblyomma americanum]|uniref:Uncharacterized protein n=1 Tax=Amblyomma americanum TaxID=6943 RepID=A0AAQ4F928_AMBAM